MSFSDEYLDQYAHFIAGGKTLALIEQYEEDEKNYEKVLKNLRQELGAREIFYGGEDFEFDHAITDPRFKLQEEGDGYFIYAINLRTPEGRAFQERMNLMCTRPQMTYALFSCRLTGAREIETNPDSLKEASGQDDRHYRPGATASASYRKYGDVYIVSVPRVIRGIFNEAAAKAYYDAHPYLHNHVKISSGYFYEWFTPPDSTPIPYSALLKLQAKELELKEKELGDQIMPRRIEGKGKTYFCSPK